jgi:colicin import membrane protein
MKKLVDMKKIFVMAMMMMPLAAVAQDNTWEQTTVVNADQKYLAGAVPEVNGKVVFSTTIKAEGKSKKQIYETLLDEMTKMTTEPNQFEQSRITLSDDQNYKQIVASYQEWLVFKNKPLNLDRTRFFYTIIADIKDGEANVQLTRIHYLYDEERDPFTYQAEEWITDRYGLNKKQTKLSRVSGKFRRKTIDRKDYIFNRFTQLLQK